MLGELGVKVMLFKLGNFMGLWKEGEIFSWTRVYGGS